MRHAPCSKRHAPCAVRRASSAMRYAPCAMRHAPCAVRRAPSAMRHAPCSKRHAACTVHRARLQLIPHSALSKLAVAHEGKLVKLVLGGPDTNPHPVDYAVAQRMKGKLAKLVLGDKPTRGSAETAFNGGGGATGDAAQPSEGSSTLRTPSHCSTPKLPAIFEPSKQQQQQQQQQQEVLASPQRLRKLPSTERGGVALALYTARAHAQVHAYALRKCMRMCCASA
eukprot:276884-Chlamydomonas_euryale.AAC.1